MGIFAAIRDGAFLKVLAGKVVLIQVEGSRRFRANGLGPMLFEGAQIFRFEELGESGRALDEALNAHANRREKIEGVSVAVFEEKVEKNQWSIYVALPDRDLMICATDRDMLREVLLRKAKRAEHRAFPISSREWKYLDPSASHWAMRHYDPTDAAEDSSSPLCKHPILGADSGDEGAIGFVFSDGREKQKPPRLVYLSSNPKSLDIMRSVWSRLTPRATRLEPEAVELEFHGATGNNRVEADLYDRLDILLGHAVLL